MKNLSQMLKQAQQMQEKMGQMQEELALVEMTGTAGAGLVAVTLNGKSEMKQVKIDPSLMTADEKEVLEDLLIAAHRDAKQKVETHVSEQMTQMTGGLSLPPGFKLPF